jgi:glycerol uptake facilitator-like aquaporin
MPWPSKDPDDYRPGHENRSAAGFPWSAVLSLVAMIVLGISARDSVPFVVVAAVGAIVAAITVVRYVWQTTHRSSLKSRSDS